VSVVFLTTFHPTLSYFIRHRYPYPPETYENVFAQLSAIVDGEAPGLPDDDDTPDEVVDGSLTADVSENSNGRPLGRKWSSEARDWIRQCLIKNADERATYPELLVGIDHEVPR
jgi:mitogen-activated protein kinase kinase